MNVLLSKFRSNTFIDVRIIKEMPGSLASGTLCIFIAYFYITLQLDGHVVCNYEKFSFQIYLMFETKMHYYKTKMRSSI